MAITISGTTGVAGVDGSASAPATAGTDSNSGIYYGADVIKFSTGGTERIAVSNTSYPRILQVVQTVNQAAHASGTNAIAQGAWFTPSITVAITPSSSSSKILFTGHVAASSGNSPKGLNLRVEKGGSALTGANAASVSSRTAAHSTGGTHNDDYAVTLAINYLDSPSTTSAVTYGFSIGHNNSSAQTLYINRTGSDTDNSSRGRYVTVLTAMEVAA